MSQISIENLTFAYDGNYDNIFENVNLQLNTDWKLGFIGRNGRGKTTLLKLLTGEYEYSGKIISDVKFEYFPYNADHTDSITSDVITAILPELEEWRLLREINLLQVDENALCRPFSTLSNGERTKILLAAFFLRENSFPLIDEPTNHLDMAARETVSRYLNTKKGFILVSHDRTFLDNCIDHVLSINKADIELQKGNFSTWLYNAELRDNYELAENEKLKKDVTRLQAAARQTSDWSHTVEKTKYGTKNSGLRPDRGFIGHKAAKMMKRSKTIENRREAALEKKSALLKNLETAEALKLSPLRYKSECLAEFSGVSVSYEGRQVCDGVSFQICRGDAVAICGKNGSGKTSLLKLICGEDIRHEGTVLIGSGLVISYVPQDSGSLYGCLKDYASEYGVDESLFMAVLRKLGFSRLQFEKDMADFSAGQKKKVMLARSLCEQAHLYIWDEPLNYVDVISRMQIEELLTQYRPTLLFIEHDKSFVSNIATKTVEL